MLDLIIEATTEDINFFPKVQKFHDLAEFKHVIGIEPKRQT